VGKTIRSIVLCLILSCLLFAGGYVLRDVQGRAELQHYRNEAETAKRAYQQARESELAAINTAKRITDRLTSAQKRVGSLTETVRIGAERVKLAESRVIAIENGLIDAIGTTAESQRVIQEIRGILGEVPSAGGKKN
jgi:multidrug efflux pump subunit AcrA (membrane-fusion protein)